MVSYTKLDTTENPKKKANIFSSLMFSWISEIFAIGNKRPLENDDLFPLMDKDKTKALTENLHQRWREEITKHSHQENRSLLRAMVRMFTYTDYMFLFITALLSSMGNILLPVFLIQLISELMKPQSSKELKWAVVYTGGICLSSLLRVFTTHHFSVNAWLMAKRWQSAVIGVIFQKVLHLRRSDLRHTSAGDVTNLVSCAVQRFKFSIWSIVVIICSVFEVLAVSFILRFLFGWASLAGVGFLLSLVAFYGVVGKISTILRLKTAAVTGQRLSVMSNILHGIRAVKMHAWEWIFKKNVAQIRRKELRLIRWRKIIFSTISSFLYTAHLIAASISLVTMAGFGTKLDSLNTFALLSLVGTLRITVSQSLARSMVFVADFIATVEQIQCFLMIGGFDAQKHLHEAFSINNETKSDLQSRKQVILGHNGSDLARGQKHHTSNDGDLILRIQGAICSWTGSKPTLKSLNLSVCRGDLVFIAGPVGGGKSSLLFAILKELPLLEGHVVCDGTVAYVGQQPWIFSGTVQDNILFGQPLNACRYDKVLQACDLHHDIQRFPDGHMTVIGERGILLSGGQRARVSLARAVYSNADIYLLDDPLSAVDAKVGQVLLQRCLSGILRDKTRIVVTHCVQFLKDADHIVVLKEGTVSQERDHEKFISSIPALQKERRVGNRNKETYFGSSDLSSSDERATKQSAGLESVTEDRLTGSVSWRLYWSYIRAGQHTSTIAVLMIFFILVQGFIIAPDWWLLHLTGPSCTGQHQSQCFSIYGALVGGAFLLVAVRAALLFRAFNNSSQTLHDSMTTSILKAPALFFDTNPVGRVLNRFSGDVEIMDELLPEGILVVSQILLFCMGSVALPILLNPWLILAAAPLVLVFVLIGRYFLKTTRELKRLEAINRSPIYSHFNDTLEGLVTIRTYHKEDTFIEELYRHQDTHNQTVVITFAANKWMALRLDLLCIIFATVVVCAAIILQKEPGITALSLVYTLQLVADTSQYGVKLCSTLESYMTSVERVVTYTQIEEEPGYKIQTQPPSNWPERGKIQVQNLGLVYYPGGPNIFHNVSFIINAREKVGIAGRTGAGKSSLVAALFRMPQPSGDIIIDGVNINTIDIQSSRQAMSVITQNPVLFAGSLRMNLDPFEEYEDKEVWDALEQARLKRMVETLPKQLNEEVRECGGNFSVGERQLLCLARALLKKSKVIIMDEATANVDYKTDQLIQETIRTKFNHCTVITIAHRLNAIIDYDRVLVIDNGRVVEYDKPGRLLENKNGALSRLYQCHK